MRDESADLGFEAQSQREVELSSMVKEGGEQEEPVREDEARREEEKKEEASQKVEKKKEFKFYPPLPLETQIDHQMIQYARDEGITDEDLLTGRMSEAICNIMNHAKLKHRSSLKLENWSRDGYYTRQGEVLDKLLAQVVKAKKRGESVKCPEMDFEDNIERVDYADLNEEQFLKKFEFASKPVIIRGVADDWKGKTSWRLNELLKRFGRSRFKIGESDSGRKLKVTLKQYLEYVLYGRDDSPLYLFESSLEEHPEAHEM
mmetsp:Transcript_18469/g.31607  ORF Transcript_18469/g.31607 Transcript_18469/m.31607 type:complete len:260 (+) Transcript_18469:274-1053(+)